MYLFQDLKKLAKGIKFDSAKEAQEWYRKEIAKISSSNIDREKIMKTADAFKTFDEKTFKSTKTREFTYDKNSYNNQVNVGKMYMYFYKAKHEDTLPFYDQFPLVFPIKFYGDGFLGLNMHYLPPMARASLMSDLYKTATNNKLDSSTVLQINYKILSSYATRFEGYKNCVKRYLFSHVRSRFQYVSPSDWDKAIMLPMQKWHVNPNPFYSSKASPPY